MKKMKLPASAITSKTGDHDRRELMHNCLIVTMAGILLDHSLA